LASRSLPPAIEPLARFVGGLAARVRVVRLVRAESGWLGQARATGCRQQRAGAGRARARNRHHKTRAGQGEGTGTPETSRPPPCPRPAESGAAPR
jgi:hypothetical protein